MIDRLCNAAASGKISEIENLIINEKVDPNGRHSKGNTPPIVFAARNGHLKTIKTLIKLGAKIHYAPEWEKPLIYFAVQSEKWQPVVEFLIAEGIVFDPQLKVKKDLFPAGCTLLWWLHDLKNLTSSILSKTSLYDLTNELFTHKPLNKSGKHHLSILERIFRDTFNEHASILVIQILLRSILTSQVKTFSILKLELHNLSKAIVSTMTENKELATNEFNAKIKFIEELYVNISESAFSTWNNESIFNVLPEEIRLSIANKVLSSSLPGVQDDFIQQLANLFNKMPLVEPAKNMQVKFNKLARLSFREWRHNQSFFQVIPKNNIKDLYICLEESLAEKIKNQPLSLQLRQDIIHAITEIKKENFTKAAFLQAIEGVLKSCTANENPKLRTL